ncbi:unnamed protein product, partial [Allacma fusca]
AELLGVMDVSVGSITSANAGGSEYFITGTLVFGQVGCSPTSTLRTKIPGKKVCGNVHGLHLDPSKFSLSAYVLGSGVEKTNVTSVGIHAGWDCPKFLADLSWGR